jgi:hypothetical protein
VLSSDEEGNRFYQLYGIEDENSAFTERATHPWMLDGEVGPVELTEELRQQGHDESDLMPKDAQRCIVLLPG